MYAAEDQLRATLSRGGSVDFFGSTLSMPVERRFADLPSVQRYVVAVLALDAVRSAWPTAEPVRVRERAGASRAHYEPPGVIAIPLMGSVERRWAARETVVLHELAHHLCWAQGDAPHGPRFCGTLVHLYRGALGDGPALLLRAALDGAGIPVRDVVVEVTR